MCRFHDKSSLLAITVAVLSARAGVTGGSFRLLPRNQGASSDAEGVRVATIETLMPFAAAWTTEGGTQQFDEERFR